MSRRFYVDSPVTGDLVRLEGAQGRHLALVLRARVGDEVTLFDGGGAEFLAQVRRVERSSVELSILDRRDVDRELSFLLTLGVALPKGDRQRWLVEKSVELGVTRLVPLQTRRSVAQPGPSALQRLRRTVIEASKQSGRNRLMEVLSPQPLGDYAASAPREAERWLAHGAAAGSLPIDTIAARSQSPSEPAFLAVGPEGGFTSEEVAQAESAGWCAVDLGPRILRVETAAVALAALIVLGRRSARCSTGSTATGFEDNSPPARFRRPGPGNSAARS